MNTSSEFVKNTYHRLINKTDYDYFLSLVFKDFDNLNTTKQIKKFLRYFHNNLFGRKYKTLNKFLHLTIVRERHGLSNPHFHILIKTAPHDLTFADLTKATVYAIKKCKTVRPIKNKEIPILTTNHYKKRKSMSKADTIKEGSKKKPFFPYNLVPIDTPQDQFNIIKYIFKDFSTYNTPVAITKPEREGYFDFNFDGNTRDQPLIIQDLPQQKVTEESVDSNELEMDLDADDVDWEEYFRRELLKDN